MQDPQLLGNQSMDAIDTRATLPVYFKDGYVPQDRVRDKSRVEVRQAFLETLLSKYTPVEVQSELFLKPIPPEIGQVQCTIERDDSGFKKLKPVFYLKLSYGNKMMLLGDSIV